MSALLDSYHISQHSVGFPISALMATATAARRVGGSSDGGAAATDGFQQRFQHMVIPMGLVLQGSPGASRRDMEETFSQADQEGGAGRRPDDAPTVDSVQYQRMVDAISVFSKPKASVSRKTRRKSRRA